MAIKLVKIPLFDSPYYSYTTPLLDTTYEWTFSYNSRMEKWVLRLAYVGGNPIVSGLVLSPDYPHLLDYTIDFPGALMLLPIGKKMNETISNPYDIHKYYELFVVYDNGE